MISEFKYPLYIKYLKSITKNERKYVFNQIPFFKDDYELILYLEKELVDIHQTEFLKIASDIQLLINEMQKPKEKRLKESVEFKNELKNQSKKRINILRNIKLDKSLMKHLPLDEDLINKTINVLNEHIIQSKVRTGHNSTAYIILGCIFNRLNELKWGHNKQISFIYNLFVKYKIEDYGKEYIKDNDTFIRDYEQKDRIRKVQNKAITNPKLSVQEQDILYNKKLKLLKSYHKLNKNSTEF